jgi:hypothetical protein
MNDPVTDRADSQHPWIGLASFTEGDREFFAGRGDEIDDLLRLVRRDTLTLLYGVSGLGKTSLVQAGLFPALREDNFLPVPIRLDYLEGAGPLAAQIIHAITTAAAAAKVEVPQPRADETLWEYFHREGNHFWSAHNDLVTPFLAFDQFEEFFTLGRENPARVARANALIAEFADLVENRPPALLRDDPARAKEFNFKPVPLKVLLGMREDYLADLDRIRSHFRALGQNRLRLLPMGDRQARQVIALGAPLLAPGVEDRIVTYVAGGAADPEAMTVAPALLSLVLRELNERRLARGPEAKITPDLLDVEQHKIFEDFYLRTLADFPPGVRLFIEDELLTASGHRNSAALDDALTRPDVTLPILNELVNRRLLAYEDRHNTRRVELTHDVLVPVIKASRDSRLTREALAQAERLRDEQAAQQRRHRFTLAVACALALALIGTIWGGYYLFVQEHKAYYADFAKQNGFPVGITRISEAEAHRFPLSYLIVHKGITREGWKFRWEPAFRLVAVDSQLKPTSNHTIGNYLWRKESASGDTQSDPSQKRAERLGLNTVCQWEFDSNAKGEIMYERALDQDGRMVYGFIYSPPGSGPSATRLARFVGPDGFPLLQPSSSAEYVLLHYDNHGWEDRFTYRDGKNLPAIGPVGSYGESREYNSRGQVTLNLSLDADGKNMIDSAGNSGMRVTYNDKGWLMEARSLGPDLEPMPLKLGWTVSKRQYDDIGRLTLITFYGPKDEPILDMDGCHGWTAEFDEHGNQTATTCIGLDDKPTIFSQGLATLKSVYNAQGRATRRSCYGVNGEPVLHKYGYHGWESQYDDRGNENVSTFLGLDGKPALLPGGYAIVRTTFDARGNITRRTYHGVKGEPTLYKDGYHGWESKYDERGNGIETTYIDVDGKLALLPAGYAGFEKKFDSDGNELEQAYFDAAREPTLDRQSGIYKMVTSYDGRGKVTRNRFYGIKGEPVLHKEGYHGWDAQYDERGNRILTSYVGLDEKPILSPEGLASFKSVYNAQAKVTRRSYYDVSGKPVLGSEGYHIWSAKYDERGNQLEIAYFDTDRKPTLDRASQVHQVIDSYDARGKVTRKRFYGTDGEPILHKDGYYGWDSEYDERGNELVRTYVGLDEKPIIGPYGFAIFKSVYDAQGNITRTSFYGVKGEPVLHQDGNHAWEGQYDERGNQILLTYLGTDEKPILLKDGFAMIKIAYDSRGQVTRKRFYGVRKEPVLHKSGYHGWDSEYDGRGNEVTTTYFGLDDKPALRPEGYAIAKATFDAHNNLVRRTFHLANGEPALDEGKYHGWESQYDERGNEVTITCLGLDGKPALFPDGYAIIRMAYDPRGNVIRRTYYGLKEEPVLRKGGYHGWEATYDELGRKLTTVYIGLDGKEIHLKDKPES